MNDLTYYLTKYLFVNLFLATFIALFDSVSRAHGMWPLSAVSRLHSNLRRKITSETIKCISVSCRSP